MSVNRGEITVRADGAAVRALRKLRGHTQPELALRASVKQQTVSRVERGIRVEWQAMVAVADALGVPLAVMGVSPEDRAEIAAYQETRARMEAAVREQENGDPDGTLKSAYAYRMYTQLSGYRNHTGHAVGCTCGLAGV